jgi:hypothetical protein
MRMLILIALLGLSTTANSAPVKQCYTLSSKRSFHANDKSLPLLCLQQAKKFSKTRFITMKKKIGKFGIGESEYLAQMKYSPKCRSCNKTSFKLLNVNYDSPYLVFNGKNQYGNERGYLIFRGEGYFYKSSNRL